MRACRIGRSLFLPILLMWAGSLAAAPVAGQGAPHAGKKILWVDSYHAGYAWTSAIERGIRRALDGSGVALRIVRMDTKWHGDEAFRRQAALEAKAAIDAFGPDVVISSDDNAARYLVVPYLKDTDLPVVFCGINWDATPYGFPCRNVTGILEVEPVEALVRQLRRYAKGDRLGYLSADTISERKVVEVYNRCFFDGKMKSYLARDFDHFKQLFLQAQQEVDMIYIANHSDMPGWDPQLAEAFLARHTRLPTGSRLTYMERYVVVTLAHLGEEQGEWAAHAALRILDGVSPAAIPLASNEQVSMTLNLKMAEAAGILLPVSTLRAASKIIGQEVLH